MRKKIVILPFFLTLAMIGAAAAQGVKSSSDARRVVIQSCELAVTLTPDVHELTAVATVKFLVLEQTSYVSFMLSDNLFVRKALNAEGLELEFEQNQTDRETLFIRFSPPLKAGAYETIRIEYEGGFDKDRFNRIFSRDTTSAYIGMEGSWLLDSAKWFPSTRFPVERIPGSLEVTVPLGMTVIGTGEQASVATQGVSETFRWNAQAPMMTGAFVAGQYSSRKTQAGDFSIDCYSLGNARESIQKSAEAAGKILAYYQDTFGAPPAAGSNFRLVEVNDALARQHGMAGTIFITRRELAQPEPPVRSLARRVAYQWWRETVGALNPEDMWLVDGLAYFSAAMYMEHESGKDAFRNEINNLSVLALKFENQSSVRDGLRLGYRSERYESVVAGKGAWVLNMLRGIMGNEQFSRLLREYLKDNVGSGGSAAAFQKTAAAIYGKELNWFFTEWLDTIGVPTLQSDYITSRTPDGFRVSGAIKQEQDLFRMPVEVSVVTRDGEHTKNFELVGKSTAFDISVFAMPSKVMVDPKNLILRDSKELRTAVQISLGDDSRQAQNFVESVRAYDEAVKLTPTRSLAHFRLGETFFDQFNLQSAANSFRDALNGDKDPQWIEVWCYIYLGKIYDILGQRQRALAEYVKAQNTKDDTNGAQAEAAKWQTTPFVKERSGTLDADTSE